MKHYANELTRGWCWLFAGYAYAGMWVSASVEAWPLVAMNATAGVWFLRQARRRAVEAEARRRVRAWGRAR